MAVAKRSGGDDGIRLSYLDTELKAFMLARGWLRATRRDTKGMQVSLVVHACDFETIARRSCSTILPRYLWLLLVI
eukprot:SAG11_NODE_1215_length_5501_cov_4.190820_7_plen_76_part_00